MDLITAFEVRKEPQELIRRAKVATLDPWNLYSLVQDMDTLVNPVDFNEKAQYGLLRNFGLKV